MAVEENRRSVGKVGKNGDIERPLQPREMHFFNSCGGVVVCTPSSNHVVIIPGKRLFNRLASTNPITI